MPELCAPSPSSPPKAELGETTNLSGGYDPSFFDELAAIEDRHFWFRARNRLISELSRRICSRLKPEYLVLEVGCGTGNVLRALRKACSNGTVVGMDLWFEGLIHAQMRSNALLVQGDVRHCPFGKRFDLIGMFDVLEHVPEDVEILCALRNLLDTDGKLMLTVPAHQYLWSYFDEASRHCRRYSPEEIRRKLTAAGFEVEFLSQYMATIWPLMWVLRKVVRPSQLSHSDNARMSASREFRLVPVVNAILEFLLNQEARWLASGHSLPIGTSLAVVARRTK
jgi:SAM-dependent methyltransferase